MVVLALLSGLVSLVSYYLDWSAASFVFAVPLALLLPIVVVHSWVQAGRFGLQALRMRGGSQEVAPTQRTKAGEPWAPGVPHGAEDGGGPERSRDHNSDVRKDDDTARSERCGSDEGSDPKRGT